MKSTFIDVPAVGVLEVDFTCRVRDEVYKGMPAYTTEFYIQSARFIDSGLSLPSTEFDWVADEMYDIVLQAKKAGELEEPTDMDYEDWTLDYSLAIEDFFVKSRP